MIKRARPALGTIVVMRLHGQAEDAIDEAVLSAFDLIEDLEQKLSKHREISDVSRFNQTHTGGSVPVSAEFCTLLDQALHFWQTSEHAFDPFCGANEQPLVIEHQGPHPFATRTAEGQLDLSGIAKGFIVDQASAHLASRGLSGVVNAGGDLRFFNQEERIAEIRLPNQTGAFRRIEMGCDALATSSFSEALHNPLSTTEYAKRPYYDEFHSVSVLAADGTTADALTKVAWFATPALAKTLAAQFHARFLIFNGAGEEVAL